MSVIVKKSRSRNGDRIKPAPVVVHVPRIVELMAACSLFSDPIAGACAACSKVLPKRRRRYCSRTCAMTWERNHIWSRARAAAKRRDKYCCTTCGRRGRKHGETDGLRIEVNHRLAIVEIPGAKREFASCAHHLDNLETLCSVCHAIVTKRQATARATARRELKTRAALANAACPINVNGEIGLVA